MGAYASVSALDPPGRTWCPLTAAMAQISVVEQLSRANSKANHALQNRLHGAEMSVRSEWARVLQSDPRMTLGDAIHVVGKRHSIWPLLVVFATMKHANREKPEKKRRLIARDISPFHTIELFHNFDLGERVL